MTSILRDGILTHGKSKKQRSIDDWKRMHDELTNPEKREEVRRQFEIQKMADDKRKDTGIC